VDLAVAFRAGNLASEFCVRGAPILEKVVKRHAVATGQGHGEHDGLVSGYHSELGADQYRRSFCVHRSSGAESSGHRRQDFGSAEIGIHFDEAGERRCVICLGFVRESAEDAAIVNHHSYGKPGRGPQLARHHADTGRLGARDYRHQNQQRMRHQMMSTVSRIFSA
jgi:hypothetical protein